MKQTTPLILVMCTSNSDRSQMAEAWLRHFAGSDIEVYSAGLTPHGIHPLTIQVMTEAGLDISRHAAKNISLFEDFQFDYQVTVCDKAHERCPYFPGSGKVIHKNFADPSADCESAAQMLHRFRKVRDQIRDWSQQFLAQELGMKLFYASSANWHKMATHF